jgi:uncharacterized protein (DUF1800 family)
MSDASIALNRFGLGARQGDAAAEPRAWLHAQLKRFEVRPPRIAALPQTSLIATELADYIEKARGLKDQEEKQQKRRAAGSAPPEDSGTGEAMTASAGAKMQPGMSDPAIEARRFANKQGRDYYAAAVTARTLCALDTQAPFVERLVHFWANHFAVSADKLPVIGIAGMMEFEAIRPHVLGNFGEMLSAVERHPAMLLYLDQAQSVGPNSVAGQLALKGQRPRKLGLNENLAREIMELHTLGVRSVYTQADVTEFARAMTGWTVAGLTRGQVARFTGTDGEPGNFVFAERLHEPGARKILGKAWPDGDLPSVYRVLIDAPECWAPQRAKFKTPWEWSVSAHRALGTRELRPLAMVGLTRELGQPVWQPGSPAGWDDVAASWAGPDAILRRVEAAQRMAQRTQNLIDARARAPELFPGALSDATAQAIARAESPGQGIALMLVAPEFMRR